ncbi:MAG: tRNA uridine-5-carboxymethylaminomethyl(34) synthesis GTPase MnmE [Proteobacteria bacterium]|nr:tRNA uridine-5-carboxymethylaminomethyl(34) synthesis GTPase MnmE [Pseudomonadota bacterium]
MNLGLSDEPIAALASGTGPGAIAVVRISGRDVWSLVAPCLRMTPDVFLVEKHLQVRCFLRPSSGAVIDEIMVAWFVGPRSFTGENTVEIFCHGGPYLISEILSTLYEQGVRPAKPGEFTKRALLNGKLDLTAAEGIKDLVEAQSRQEWLSGRQLYTGKLRMQIEDLRRALVEAMAWLEAMIDFPDEGDTHQVHLTQVAIRVKRVEEQIGTLVRTFKSGHVASQGLMVAIAGAPNAGKSTLLNSLLGRDRAIVSAIAGTTRDYIQERCLIEGRLVRLVDMAGIRETSDEVELSGVRLSRQMVAEADVVVFLFAADGDKWERQAIEAVALTVSSDKNLVRIVTKSDLVPDLGSLDWAADMLPISCETGCGLQEFKQKLIAIVDGHVEGLADSPFITSARQQSCLAATMQALHKFWSALALGSGHELLAFELQEAARELAGVIGTLSNEDVLDKVFSEFCIGK